MNKIKSMTGFGRAEASDEKHKITVEMKAVNHRYLDLSIRMPRKLNLFEARIRTLVKSYAVRGKVDLFVTCEDFSEEALALKYNETLAGAYVDYIQQMSQKFGIPNDLTAGRLAGFPEVLVMEHPEEDEETLWPLLEEALQKAGEAFAEQKTHEGERLAQDILQKLTDMEEQVSFIEERSPEVVKAYEERMAERMRELLEQTEVDEARLMTEAAIFADKTCVDEETVRLRSHITAMRQSLSKGTPEGVGRRLDFLAQEMNREANTTLSKCNDMDISATAITLKTEIEKIREQVQNIE